MKALLFLRRKPGRGGEKGSIKGTESIKSSPSSNDPDLLSKVSLTPPAEGHSPLNKLPSELLLYIFRLLPNHRNTFRSVCRLWNNIVVETATFWTIISLVPITYKPPGIDIYRTHRPLVITRDEALLRLKTLIDRTGMIPLTVIWNIPYDNDYRIGLPLVQELIIYFLEHVPFGRWRRLKLRDYFRPDFHGIISEKIQRAMTRLIIGPSILEELQVSALFSAHNPILKYLDALPHKIRRFEVIGETHGPVVSYAPFTQKATTLLFTGSRLTIADIGSDVSVLYVGCLGIKPHSMPGVKSLNINVCWDMRCLANINAPLLTQLQIDDLKESWRDVVLTFPNLRVLAVSGEIKYLFYVRASKLQTLRLGKGLGLIEYSTESSTFSNQSLTRSIRSLQSQMLSSSSYTLLPSTLILHTSMDVEDVTWFLQYTCSVRHLTVMIDPRLKTKMYSFLCRILSRDSIARNTQDPFQAIYSRNEGNLCSEIVSLTLSLDWPQIDTDFWMCFAGKLLRSGSSNVAAMESITFEWSDGNKVTRTLEKASRCI